MESKFVLLLALFLLLPLDSHCSTTSITRLFEAWCEKHGRNYSSVEEKQRRLEIFADNYAFVNEHNEKRSSSYTLALNAFADLSHDEFKASYLHPIPTATSVGRNVKEPRPGELVRDIPEKMDWREKGAVTRVKDQRQCGASYAFAAVGAIEGINKITTGSLLTLSEQEVIDCDRHYNQGCASGLVYNAFMFVFENNGIDTEERYPYTGEDLPPAWSCDNDYSKRHFVTIDGYTNLPPENETLLLQAVATQPVSAYICVGKELQLYEKGIYTGPCAPCLNHAVLIVGYDTLNGTDYWIIKNSWGPWGMGGYILMKRNIGDTRGLCGINMLASYPIKTGPNPPPPSPPGPVLCEYFEFCSPYESCCCIWSFGLCLQWTCCSSSSVCDIDHGRCVNHSSHSTNTYPNLKLTRNGRREALKKRGSSRKFGGWSSFFHGDIDIF